MSCDCGCKDGERGPRGLPGTTGDTGTSGSVGAQGAKGPQGLQGLAGAVGLKGDKGDKGDQGIQGITGHAGVPGVDGTQGIPGPVGSPGSDGAAGADGSPGAQGIQGIQGPTGLTGAAGIGRYILGAYNDTTGIGNSDAIGDETLLFRQDIVGNTLSNNGDELELFIHTEYFASDTVDIIFDMNAANRYSYSYQNANNDIRFIKIKIARINSASQLWTIEDVTKTLVGPVFSITTIATFTTTYDLTTPMSFEIFADNLVLGADQVVLKKAVMYLNKLN